MEVICVSSAACSDFRVRGSCRTQSAGHLIAGLSSLCCAVLWSVLDVPCLPASHTPLTGTTHRSSAMQAIPMQSSFLGQRVSGTAARCELWPCLEPQLLRALPKPAIARSGQMVLHYVQHSALPGPACQAVAAVVTPLAAVTKPVLWHTSLQPAYTSAASSRQGCG